MKLLFLLLGFALLSLVAVVFGRALALTSKQVSPGDSPPIVLDSQALAGRLSRAVSFQTVSHQDPDQFRGDEFVSFHAYLQQAFPRVHAALNREVVAGYSLLYTWNGRDRYAKPILLAAHLDVVPAEKTSGSTWTHPAFEGRIADGYIWGRGSLDDKNSVLGIMEAVEHLLEKGFAPNRTIYLAFGHDEELGGKAGAAKIAELLNAKGVEMDYVLDEGLTIVQGVIPDIAKPVALVGIAEKGSVSIELAVQGEGGHSMMPPQHTAIGILSSSIGRLEQNQLPTRMTMPVKLMFLSLAPEMPFFRRLVFANLWLFEPLVRGKLASQPRSNALVRTTTAPTLFHAGVKENVLATEARAVVNYRILQGQDIAGIMEHVRATVKDPRVKITTLEGFKGDPSFVSDTRSPGFATITRTARQVFPETLAAPGLVLAATDSRHYAHLTHCIFRFNPVLLHQDDLPRIHGTDERISVEAYARAVEFYARLIQNSCPGQERQGGD